MNINTSDTYLRKFIPEDLPVMSKIYADEDVMKYIGRGGAVDERATEQMLKAFMNSYERNGFGIWACVDKQSGKIIGHCGFNVLPVTGDIEIAYLLDKPYWGKGIATSIALESLQYGFDELKLNKIVALAYPQNIASIRVIEKLGMNHEGIKEFFGMGFSFFSKQSSLEKNESDNLV